MKIHLLPMGARFEYQGEDWVKTGPMSATGKSGQRLIPKYAQLKVPGDALPSGNSKSGKLTEAAVLEAFEAFYASCRQLVSADRHTELGGARERFLKALEV